MQIGEPERGPHVALTALALLRADHPAGPDAARRGGLPGRRYLVPAGVASPSSSSSESREISSRPGLSTV